MYVIIARTHFLFIVYSPPVLFCCEELIFIDFPAFFPYSVNAKILRKEATSCLICGLKRVG